MSAPASIDSGSSMLEVLEAYPGARRALFRKYHIGGCSSCGFEMSETLAGVCARNGNLDVAEALEHIRLSHEQDEQMLVSPAQLSARLKEPGALRLVDIRTSEEFAAAQIPGSIHFSQDLMQEMLGNWPRESAVVLCDHTGAKVLDAVAYFLGHGFKNIQGLKGGIDAWSREVDSSVPRYRLD